jgi:hypothetical protein
MTRDKVQQATVAIKSRPHPFWIETRHHDMTPRR